MYNGQQIFLTVLFPEIFFVLYACQPAGHSFVLCCCQENSQQHPWMPSMQFSLTTCLISGSIKMPFLILVLVILRNILKYWNLSPSFFIFIFMHFLISLIFISRGGKISFLCLQSVYASHFLCPGTNCLWSCKFFLIKWNSLAWLPH